MKTYGNGYELPPTCHFGEPVLSVTGETENKKRARGGKKEAVTEKQLPMFWEVRVMISLNDHKNPRRH